MFALRVSVPSKALFSLRLIAKKLFGNFTLYIMVSTNAFGVQKDLHSYVWNFALKVSMTSIQLA